MACPLEGLVRRANKEREPKDSGRNDEIASS